MVKKSNDNSQIVSILSYFLVGIIWYFVDSSVQNSKTKFQVKQALNLIITSFVIHIAVTILTVITLGLFALIGWIFSVALLVFWIIGLINAINMKETEIPILGQFANKYLTF